MGTVPYWTELRSVWLPHLPIQRLQPILTIVQKGRQFLHQRKGNQIITNALQTLNSPHWVLKEVFPTVGETFVGLVHNVDDGETAVIKVTTSDAAKESLQNHIDMLEKLKTLNLSQNDKIRMPHSILVQDVCQGS